MADALKRDQQAELRRRREARRSEGVSLLVQREREGELARLDPRHDAEGAEGAALVVEESAPPVPGGKERGARSDTFALLFLALALLVALAMKVGRGGDGRG